KERLDLNRNFPAHWRQEFEQYGAGPFPGSEPEVYNLVKFIAAHPNITGGLTFHTFSGVLLRPYGTQADEAMPAEDLWTFQAIGNPPPPFLEKEIAPLAEWALWHALLSPRLEIHSATATMLADLDRQDADGCATFHIRLVVDNTGWLPTYISKRGLEKKVARA